MGIREILDKALEIGSEAKLRVRIYESPTDYTESEMTYVKLGMYLISNLKAIDRIDVRLI